MSTISDVAAAAGVSSATVSRYMQGQHVRSADRIEQAVEDLDYRPSPAARTLKSRSTGSIAVVVPDITNPYFAAVVKGVESISRHEGYHIFLYNTEEDGEWEAAVLADLRGRVDGVILTPADESLAACARLSAMGIPTVLMDREFGDDPHFDRVLIGNAAGAGQAANYLIGLGHTEVAIISGPLETTPGRGRHDGFVDAVEAAGLELKPTHVQMSDFREEGGYQSALRLLALEAPPTAIFVANNLMTLGALRALHDLRIRVPEDISVIGFDDLQFAELLNPPLTVIGRPMAEQGALAMRMLLNRLTGRSATPRAMVLDTRLVIRESCAPPHPSRPLRSSKKVSRNP